MGNHHLDLNGVSDLKELYYETVLVRDGDCRAVIVTPESDEYNRLAKAIQDKIKECSGVLIPIIDGSLYSQAEHGRYNAIMLGNICVNKALIPLYHLYYVLTDREYPGRGCYEVRTVHDPWGLGTNIILLGGSDLEGVRRSVETFLRLIKPGRTIIIKRLLLVKLSDDLKKSWPTSPPTEEEVKKLRGKAREAMITEAHRNLAPYVAYAGFMYYRTGHEAYARLFKEFMYMWEDYSKRPMTSTRKVFGRWGFDADFSLYLVIPAWDLVEESSVFTDEERLRITKVLIDYVRDCVPHVGDVSKEALRHNHSTFAALGLLYAGIYFAKYYRSEEAETWLKTAERCFSPQVKAFKPYEDCNSYQWITLYHTMKYSLVKSDPTFFETGNAKRAVDYAILTMDNLGCHVPYGDVGGWQAGYAYLVPFLEGVAFRLKDGRCLWILEKKGRLGRGRSAPIRMVEVNHYRCDIEPLEPKDMIGVVSFPLERGFFELFKEDSETPYERTFDKIAFRTSFNPDKHYLLLDGTSRGGHAHYDGNAILRITGKGRTFLDDGDYIKSLPKYHNSILVLKDGWSSKIPPFCELEHLADLNEVGFSQSSLKGYSGADWFRSVVWRKERYFLIIDELVAKERNDYSFHCIWRLVGDLEASREGVSVDQKGVKFWLKTLDEYALKFEVDAETGMNWKSYPYAEPLVHVVREVLNKRLEVDESQMFFNLLYISEDGGEQYHISRAGESSVEISGEDNSYIGVNRGGSLSRVRTRMEETSPETDASIYYISPEGFSLVEATRLRWIERLFQSDRPVSIEFNLNTGEGVIVSPHEVRLGFYGGTGIPKVIVDGVEIEAHKVDGLIHLRVDKGRHKIRVLNLVSHGLTSRLNGDFRSAQSLTGRAVQRAVEAVGHKNLEEVWCWRNPVEGQSFSSLFTADIDGDGEDEVLVGSTDGWVYTLKGDGTLLWRFKTGERVNSLWAKDIDGDGFGEVVIGSSDANLYVLSYDGKKRWSQALEYHMRKAVVTTVFSYDLDGDGKDEVIAGSENWRYYAFDHSGVLKWFCETVRRSTVGCAADIDNDGKGEVIAGTEYYVWHMIDHKGEKRWSYHPRTPGVNSVAVADLDGNGMKEVIFGGRDAHIHVLTHDGKVMWKRNVGDEVTRVLGVDLDEDGKDEVVAGAMSFNVYVLKGDGTRVWRRNMGDRVTSLTVSKLSKGGGKDVIVGLADGTVHILDCKGEERGRYNFRGEVKELAAADIDGDGVNEIVAITEGTIHALRPVKTLSERGT